MPTQIDASPAVGGCIFNSYLLVERRGIAAALSMGDSGTKKRKRGGGGEGGCSSDDSEAAEERAEHHYMLHVGDEFDHGRYSVMSQLGKGTFGRVVEMWDTTERRSVAVKVVRAVEKCALTMPTKGPLPPFSARLTFICCHTCCLLRSSVQVRARGRDRGRDYPRAAAHAAPRAALPDRSPASDL